MKLSGKMCLRDSLDIVLLKYIDQLRERRCHPYACLVLYALVTLFQSLLDDHGKVFLLRLVFRLVQVHEHLSLIHIYYISEKKMKELKEGNCFPVMGCRSALSPWKDENGNYKFYGRFNQGVVTINLVDVALSSGGDMERFWKIFDERLDLCYRALMCRHNRLNGTLSEAAPILWQ